MALTGRATAGWVTRRDERGHKNARRRDTCGDGNWGGLQPFPWAAEAAGAAIRTAPGHVMNAMPPQLTFWHLTSPPNPKGNPNTLTP